MIGRLLGRVFDSEPDGTLILDVAGVGYELVTPAGTLGRAVPDPDGRITLHVHTHVREDALMLFGFALPEERETFRTLIAIPKVGPKLALAVLGAVSVDELADLVARGHVGQITKVPGIGKKTAERMILELEGKLTRVPTRRAAPAVADDQGSVLAAALVRMGFKQSEAERAVQSVDDLGRPMSELIRDALAVLSP